MNDWEIDTDALQGDMERMAISLAEYDYNDREDIWLRSNEIAQKVSEPE